MRFPVVPWRVWLVLVVALIHLPTVSAHAALASDSMLVYIGTYTGTKSQGIYRARFDSATGRLTEPELVAETQNPTFLALHPKEPWLYAVNEVDSFEGKHSGAVSAFSFDEKSGKLTALNQKSSGGSGPCHLAVDHAGQYVLVANYGSGSVAALPLEPNGRLREPSAPIQHHGSSINPQRQAGPHAHFIIADPGNRFALACDLGLDKVLVYRLDPAGESLVPNEPPSISVGPGSGPRHLAFDTSGRFIYLLNELVGTLETLAYDAQAGRLTELDSISTLPQDFHGPNLSAEVQVHPSGKFVYASNRGHDSIAVFAVDAQTGKLSLIERAPTQGRAPRHFAVDPSGRWLLVENQDSDNIVEFRVDRRSGHLSPTGQAVQLGAPVCLLFVQAKR